MSKRLTQREIDAICEALAFRTAGFFNENEGTQPREVYDSALEKMSTRLKDERTQ